MRHRPPARRRRLEHVPQAPPLGAEGGIEAFRPAAAAPGSRVRCRGWAWPFDDERVRSVQLVLDGAPAGDALLTLRPDIAEALDLPDAMLSGFVAEIEIPHGEGLPPPELTAVAHGMSGAVWPGLRLTLPADPATLSDDPLADDAAPSIAAATAADATDAPKPAAGPSPVDEPNGERELARRRLGYDPWHRVVLIEEAAAPLVAGPAVAALDVVAERHPGLELLIAGVTPESVLADFLRRAIAATGLADRVTVPPTTPQADEPPGGWAAIADASLDAAPAIDLAATVERLSAIAAG